ncbi:steroid 5-alpha-reductase DET2-like [Zingiber officinale]|nr:steroid 5-alpha-reductase DET2-like [Zingiber officinale]XP_042380135.1 steroid 5-alpha-reductase DET2-like [Zingiber officinale]
MEELEVADLFSIALFSFYALCPVSVAALQFLTAPYGKHVRPGWGPSLPAPLAWFLMESPTLWLTLLLYPRGRHRSHPFALAVLSLYLLHYVHRTIVYPLRLHFSSSSSKKAAGFPLLIALFGFAFNLLNAYLQSRSISHYADYTGHQAQAWLRAAAGAVVFFWGMAINITSDSALMRLKAEGGGYKIPRGGWFELVSCPNYMGEMMEWLGWAVMAWLPAAMGFFLYTCSNLGPRARANLQWYRDKFGDAYPKSRKAFVPFIY